ncbi:50S ribosomal protein L24e [Methanolapillus millepedarum]|uniref:Large ribosomal subunit protein eL24 n=1 Tax=Methanolapillus millepedarum TaxID=3028296 RepID=A0AA96ZWJ2_9EURY|nr:hypothetical protein MsAc7_16190 [Methanosarcinaceae archaeon Ac7]
MDQKKCSFCGKMIELGTGRLYVKKDGTAFYLCSSKCQSNLDLGRLPRKTIWTEKGRAEQKRK